jgi:cell division protein FtsI (penicillin-binding protein 3)
VVRGTAAVANGGILLRPTILAVDPESSPIEGTRVMQPSTSDTMRKLMRLVVTDGFGKTAEVPGYYPGGKTGTAEKVAAHGGYKKHTNVAAFMSVFPMNAPRYAVYMMLDEPHANASTHGYATAGWVAAPSAGRVIARIGPMLGMLPDIEHAAEINQALAIPLQPGRPATARPPQTGVPIAKAPQTQPATPTARLNQTLPALSRPPANQPATLPSPRDPRHEAQAPTQLPTQLPRGPIGASLVPASVMSADVGASRLAPR